jgi:hypothetical protein
MLPMSRSRAGTLLFMTVLQLILSYTPVADW